MSATRTARWPVRSRRARFEEELAIWATYAGEDLGVAGAFSLADLVVVPDLATAVHLGIALPPGLGDYLGRMRGRPAIATTWPAARGHPA